MKILLFITVLISTITNVFSQKYMDDIANESCECLNKISDTLSTDRFNMEFGLCIMEAARPYKKQLKKDFDIDFNEIERDGEMIGLRMATTCPTALMKVVNTVEQNEFKNLSGNVVTGQVTAISDDKFVEFSIRDEVGKISKYYWFTFIESDYQLSTDYKSLIDKNVQVHFKTEEFFDARIGEYRTVNIIEKIIVTEE